MTAWTPAQQTMRDEWGIADLEREPLFHATVDPAYYPPAKPVSAGADKRMTGAETAAAIVADYHRQRTKFRREVPLERARLAFVDPDGERDAIAPIAPSRARHTLRQAAIAAARHPVVNTAVRDRRESARDLLTRLGADPTETAGIIACPSHEDEHPSLSWKLAGDRALLHCFAGCTFTDILAAAS